MNEGELRLMRLEMKLTALEITLKSLIRGFAPLNPSGLAAWKKQVLEIQQSKHFADHDPAIAMLRAAEYEDALRALLDGL